MVELESPPSPPNNAVNVPPKSINFKWKTLNHINETSFRYYISVQEDSEPKDIFFEDFVGYEKEIQLLGFDPGKKYVWHVWAVDDFGKWCLFS